MNTERFMTCIRAYFPGAPVAITNNGNGDIQTVTVTNDQLFPHKFVITNDVDNHKVLLYVNGLKYPRSIVSTNPMMSEDDLLHTLKLFNLGGWRMKG